MQNTCHKIHNAHWKRNTTWRLSSPVTHVKRELGHAVISRAGDMKTKLTVRRSTATTNMEIKEASFHLGLSQI